MMMMMMTIIIIMTWPYVNVFNPLNPELNPMF